MTIIYGEHDWMNPAAGAAVAEILDGIRERKVGGGRSFVFARVPVHIGKRCVRMIDRAITVSCWLTSHCLVLVHLSFI